ncbi:peptidase M28 [Novosphingobium fuchskuhlense]|uniref:Peptidase M28 n=1 Tax=Novosphingobium fuchskuhlense TaxID=1117702 RepID=A0A117UVB5_9SPHN|nr:peptidase M28 [Novosphingobium fuchskuhlense]
MRFRQRRRLAKLFFALLALVPMGALAAGPSKRQQVQIEAQLRQHVTTLASEEYGGREPGTPSETLTLRYLARQWFDIGLESGTNDPGNAWFAPVELVEREPQGSRAQFFHGKRRVPVADGGFFVVTSGLRSLIENAPLVYVGKSLGGDGARTELAGRVAVILDSEAKPEPVKGAGSAGAPPGLDRAGKLLESGAAAVLTVLDGERTLDGVIARRRRAGYALSGERIGGDIEVFVSADAARQMFAAAGAPDLAALRAAGAAPGFSARPLGIAGSFEATNRETRIKTHNLIGKLEGRRPGSGALVLMAHWDHFGKCAAPPAEKQICPGAVDNASGLAVLTEVARLLSAGKQLDRDVYFVATTGEELGLLGALAFTENPPLPLNTVVAAFNVDSTGLVPAGLPVSVVGQGLTPLDPGIAKVLKAMKRKLAPGEAANAFARRQDSWALMQHDVPAVMVSTSYSDPTRLEFFMDNIYHRPYDEAARVIYGGMVDDVLIQTELLRFFADTKAWPAAGRGQGRAPVAAAGAK